MGELLVGLAKYFIFNNGEHPHQSLQNNTPNTAYENAARGGALIVDKYGATEGLPYRCDPQGLSTLQLRV